MFCCCCCYCCCWIYVFLGVEKESFSLFAKHTCIYPFISYIFQMLFKLRIHKYVRKRERERRRRSRRWRRRRNVWLLSWFGWMNNANKQAKDMLNVSRPILISKWKKNSLWLALRACSFLYTHMIKGERIFSPVLCILNINRVPAYKIPFKVSNFCHIKPWEKRAQWFFFFLFRQCSLWFRINRLTWKFFNLPSFTQKAILLLSKRKTASMHITKYGIMECLRLK